MRVAFVYSAIKLHLHVAPLLNGLLVAASQWNPAFDSFCWKKKKSTWNNFCLFSVVSYRKRCHDQMWFKKTKKHSELITTDMEAIWTSWTKCSLISNLFGKDEVFRSSKCLGVEGNICCNIFHSLSVTFVFTSFQPGLLIKREAHLCLCLQPPPPSLPLIFLLKRMLCCTCRVFRTKQIFRNAYFCFVFWEIDQAKQVNNFSFICPMYVTVRDTLNTLVRPTRSCRRPNVKPISLIWETALVLGYSNPHKNL